MVPPPRNRVTDLLEGFCKVLVKFIDVFNVVHRNVKQIKATIFKWRCL
jgi:hypothetical protein